MKKLIERINKSLRESSSKKVQLALDLLYAKNSTDWKLSSYGSWRAFCAREVALSQASIYVYLNTARLAEDKKLSKTVMVNIVKLIGWDRFRIGLSKLDSDEKVVFSEFVERFKDLNLNQRVTYNEDQKDTVRFTFDLPKKVADSLTEELLLKGMRITNKSRSNMSSAMAKIVEDIEKSDV